MEINLKPCPFCGKIPKIERHEDSFRRIKWGIECVNEDCDIQPMTPWYQNKKDTIDSWNKRADDGKD